MKGTYILVIYIEEDSKITIGALGNLKFREAFYLYVGSAMGDGSTSLENRIKRHISTSKKLHWHIDYLLDSKVSVVSTIYLIPTQLKLECIIAKELNEISNANIRGFGSSDCNCESHLFYLEEFRNFKKEN